MKQSIFAGQGGERSSGLLGASARERDEAERFFADLMAGAGAGAAAARPLGRRRRPPRRGPNRADEPWSEAVGDGVLQSGPLTDSEWHDVVTWLGRGEVETGSPLGADPDRNALLVAAKIFCTRNVFRMDSRREDPLLCVLDDVTMHDPRTRALLPHVTARGPLRLWQLVSSEDRQRYVMRALTTVHGYPANGAAGLVGNLVAESGVIPSRLEGSRAATPMRAANFANQQTDFSADDIVNRNVAARLGPKLPGIGLAQWTSTARRAGLFQHNFRGVRLGAQVLFDMDAQIDYLVTELRGGGFAAVERVLTSPTVTVAAASDEVVYNFEVPGALLDGGRKLPRTAAAVQAVFLQRRPLAQAAARLLAPAPVTS